MQQKTYSKEEIRNVHGNVDGNTHVGEMETVAQPDQSQSNDMMQDQLFEILSRLLQHEQQHNSLLSPITRLQEIVSLEDGLVGAVRETLKHGIRVEVPDGRATHDVQPKGTENGKVHGRVELLHEPGLLCFPQNAQTNGQRADHALHEELAGEAQDDGVKGDKGEISLSLAILNWLAGRGVERVGEEDAVVEGVRGRGVDSVKSEDQEHEDQGIEPCVSERDADVTSEETACLAALGCACSLVVCRGRGALREPVSPMVGVEKGYGIDAPEAAKTRSREQRLQCHLGALLQDC
jgi:hypothetical protein